MSKKSRAGGTAKPSPKELLKELESIRASLSTDDGEADAQVDSEETSADSPVHEAETLEPGAQGDHPSQTLTQDLNVNSLPGQQSLFEGGRESAAKSPDGSSAASDETPLENPFLPQHIKERLEREKSLYQQEIDAAVKIPGLNPYADKIPVEDSLIDELVKMYLPQIEEELRRRLSDSLKNIEDDQS